MEQGRQHHGHRGAGRRGAPMQKLKPVPKNGVAMRTPTMALISLPETEGPSSGDAEAMRSGPGSCPVVSPANGVPSVAAVGDEACVWWPLAAICAHAHRNAKFRPGYRCARQEELHACMLRRL